MSGLCPCGARSQEDHAADCPWFGLKPPVVVLDRAADEELAEVLRELDGLPGTSTGDDE